MGFILSVLLWIAPAAVVYCVMKDSSEKQIAALRRELGLQPDGKSPEVKVAEYEATFANYPRETLEMILQSSSYTEEAKQAARNLLEK